MIKQEQENPTTEQMQAIVDEIRAFGPEGSEIDVVRHLYELGKDVFLVRYVNGYTTVFNRRSSGKLLPTDSWSYYREHNFADMHGQNS